MGQVVFQVSAQMPPTTEDVDKVEVTVFADGVQADVLLVAPNVAYLPLGRFAPGTKVDASIVFIDAAGNRSRNPTTATATVEDNVPPDDPPPFSLVIDGQSIEGDSTEPAPTEAP